MKVAVVTGAAGGIGSAICTRLVDRGYRVLAVDIDATRLAALPSLVTPVVADLTTTAFPDQILTAINELGGRCDLLVNNAGTVVTTPIEQVSVEEIVREQQINLQAPMLLTRALFGRLRESHGQVVSVVSLASMLPLAHSPGYCASKAGLRAYMQALSLRERETSVSITMVHPGAVDTAMLLHEARTGGSPLNFLTAPMKPEAVAEVVINQLDRPRVEIAVPRYDGFLITLAAAIPGLLRRATPLLERLGRRGMRSYLQNRNTS